MVHQNIVKLATLCLSAVALSLGMSACQAPSVVQEIKSPATNVPPPTPREFRAVWVATVANIDWPSKPGLPAEQQQAEIRRILDQAKAVNMNAVVLQVRPSTDAIYPSPLEPWTEYLTGEQGKPPEPMYDPLKMWIDEARARGLELHAWLNPYRSRGAMGFGPLAKNHIANTDPQAVKTYGKQLWMDPAEPKAVERTLAVVTDLLRRYDLDGIHMDDYFYPYPIKPDKIDPVTKKTSPDADAADVDFPDEPAWQRYVASDEDKGAKKSRADWRRAQVNRMVESTYKTIRAEKPWVKFGISPFGLGQPNLMPAPLKGFNQYDKLYADAELWLKQGWVDYFVPQLYWAIDSKEQPFAPLLDYWSSQNTAKRHVWPGLYTSRIRSAEGLADGSRGVIWKPDEIANQIAIARGRAASNDLLSGHVHFSMISITQNREGIADRLKAISPDPAVTPTSPWMAAPRVVETPTVKVDIDRKANRAAINLSQSQSRNSGHSVNKFGLWARYGQGSAQAWVFHVVPVPPPAPTQVLPTAAATYSIASKTERGDLNEIAAVAFDRFSNESKAQIVVLK
jgi:uncharacterized lipoprotein YddW (UPF0748 family)